MDSEITLVSLKNSEDETRQLVAEPGLSSKIPPENAAKKSRVCEETLPDMSPFFLEEGNPILDLPYESAYHLVDKVSHDCRSSLNVINEFTSIIYDGLAGPINAEQHEYLSIVSGRVDDLAALLDGVLIHSRLAAGLLKINRRLCGVDKILEQIEQTLNRKASTQGVELQTMCEEELPLVFCDPERIGCALITLVERVLNLSKKESSVVIWSGHSRSTSDVLIGVTSIGVTAESQSIACYLRRLAGSDDCDLTHHDGHCLTLRTAEELVRVNLGETFMEIKEGHENACVCRVPTLNLPTLLSRYWDRVQEFRKGVRFVSLIQINASAIDTSSIAQLESLLQDRLRCSDLLFPSELGCVSLIIASRTADLASLCQRVDEMLEEGNRNNPKAFPHLRSRLCGTWLIPDHRVQFLSEVGEKVSDSVIKR